MALITAITHGQNDGSPTVNKDADDAEKWHSPFTESIYTMLYICKFQSQAFWYGLFIHFLQIVTISLTLIDVVDFTGINGNPLRMPPMVDMTVTCSQGVTLFLALAYQSDLIEAVLKLKDGFYPEVLPKYPGATYSTWLFSCLAQLLAGLLLLTSTFILTMQASDVLTIMLNFAGKSSYSQILWCFVLPLKAVRDFENLILNLILPSLVVALHFMADIDDLGFALAKLGFITNKLQFETMEVLEFEVPKRKQTYMLRRILFYLTLLGIFIGYAWLKTLQLDGYYLQTILYVQFGDGYNPKIPFYSGFLSSGTARTRGHRKYRDIGTQEILLAYCVKENAWTFSDTNDPCKYFAKSYKTRSYDVTSIPDSEWQVLDSYNRLQPFQSFSLVGRDCDPDSCRGECVEELCVCPTNHFGTDCEFTDVCPEVVLDGAFQPFPSVDSNSISDEFHLLYNTGTGNSVRVYNMPVYYSNKTFPANIIFFGGRRWVLTNEDGLFNLTSAQLENSLQNYFPKKTVNVLESGFFHGHFQAGYTPLFLSDPVDFETPAFQPTPSGLGWSTVAIIDEDNRLFGLKTPVDTVLGCVSCLSKFGGYCDEEGGSCNQTTGLCDCRSGFEGSRCERQQPCYQMDFPCWGDGICDKNDGFCRCNLPWFGKLCDIHYYCHEEYGSCLNGGVCNHTSGLCNCPEDPALAGYACEKRKDCHIYGCENGGICSETTGICDCPSPYSGVLCSLLNGTRAEVSDCGINATDCSAHHESAAADFLPCEDDMECGSASSCTFDVAENGSGVCVPLNVTDCHDKGCSERGFCNAGGHCECPFPYAGPSCDYYVEEFLG